MRPFLIAGLCLMASLVSTPDVSPQIVRRVENLPDRLHWWIVSTDGKQVFAFGARVLQEELPQTDVFTIDVDRNPPYSGVEIDPSTESVVNTHQIQEVFLPFRNAAYFKALWGGESVWLTRDYDRHLVALERDWLGLAGPRLWRPGDGEPATAPRAGVDSGRKIRAVPSARSRAPPCRLRLAASSTGGASGRGSTSRASTISR